MRGCYPYVNISPIFCCFSKVLAHLGLSNILPCVIHPQLAGTKGVSSPPLPRQLSKYTLISLEQLKLSSSCTYTLTSALQFPSPCHPECAA